LPKKQNLKQLSENRILIFENDDELSISLSRLLCRENFNVFIAINIEQAIELLDNEEIQCVIYGLNQPFKKSIEQLKTISRHQQKPNVLVLSSFDWIEVQKEVSGIPISHFMTKPVKQEQLIRQIIEHKESAV
jgi:DNA-binding NtrC family response regulator